MSRAKNLSDSDVAKIVGILDGWSGRLTWEGLLDAVEKHLYARYTRQALHKHARIQAAFEQRKLALANGDRRQRSFENLPEMQVAMDRIARLEGELARLEAENARLLEQFVRNRFGCQRGDPDSLQRSIGSRSPDSNRTVFTL